MTRTATPTDECRDWREADRALHRFLGREDGPFCWLEQQSEEVKEHPPPEAELLHHGEPPPGCGPPRRTPCFGDLNKG